MYRVFFSPSPANNRYRPVATRASILYFVIAALANVAPMYQYSLQYFQSLNNKRMDMSDVHDVVEERVRILIDDITNAFYENICRGLFEKDKMVYAFFIAARIMKKQGCRRISRSLTQMISCG